MKDHWHSLWQPFYKAFQSYSGDKTARWFRHLSKVLKEINVGTK